jgi:hypothetical protein
MDLGTPEGTPGGRPGGTPGRPVDGTVTVDTVEGELTKMVNIHALIFQVVRNDSCKLEYQAKYA